MNVLFKNVLKLLPNSLIFSGRFFFGEWVGIVPLYILLYLVFAFPLSLHFAGGSVEPFLKGNLFVLVILALFRLLYLFATFAAHKDITLLMNSSVIESVSDINFATLRGYYQRSSLVYYGVF